MAAVFAAPTNGAMGDSVPASPMSANSSAKRKRDDSQDSSAVVEANGPVEERNPTINGTYSDRDGKAEIRDYFNVLQSFDTEPPILMRVLPASSPAEKPQAKRQKSNDFAKSVTIADKVAENGYVVLDELVRDIKTAVEDQLTALRSSGHTEKSAANDAAVARTMQFRARAFEMYRREMTYPKPNAGPGDDALDAPQAEAEKGLVLTVLGNIAAPLPKPLFSSLPHRSTTPDNGASTSHPLSEIRIPNGVTTTRIAPLGASDKASRALTLGELFPSPRSLPPLQPPKKSVTKSSVLGFYHPEFTEKSQYRANSYVGQRISSGHWLDYSNATPSTQIKTKQRERAQSLAGHKPSSTELEINEMEALFRGAFSSFAPSRDDSAAMVPSGQMSRMWWQTYGQRNLLRMIEAEVPEGDVEDASAANAAVVKFDEAAVQKAIEEWDDSLVDPSLEANMGQKSKEDKVLDDLLEDVSDLIETLSSYQHNRNLILPTSQDRYSADPVNGDMLRNGSLAQQPNEEEMATYQALKAQLSLIIQGLPPYAVARLNSDKLEELSISTKIEVRMEEYHGVMEEDEPVARARQPQAAMQAAAPNVRQQPQRTPSLSGAPFAAHQYSPQQYAAPNRTPMPHAAPYYQQTPPRGAQLTPNHQRPVPMPIAHQQQRPSPGQPPYRPPINGYPGYGPPQLPKAQNPYSHAAIPYGGSPATPHMAPHPGYGQQVAPTQPGTPHNRYPTGYQHGYPQQHQQAMHPQQPQPQQHLPQHGAYSPHANGAGHMQPHAAMPAQQMGARPPYPQQQHGSQPRPPYAPHQGIHPNPQQRHYSGPPGLPSPGHRPGPPGTPTSFKTVMDATELQRTVAQANARFRAQERSHSFGDRISSHGGGGQVAGLAGIGLGGSVDLSKLAAARATAMGAGGSGGSHLSPSPKPQLPTTGRSSPSVNGGGPQAGAGASPASVPAASMSPAPAPAQAGQSEASAGST